MRSKRPQPQEAMLYPGVIVRGSQTIVLKSSAARVIPLQLQPTPVQRLSSVVVDKPVHILSARRRQGQKNVV